MDEMCQISHHDRRLRPLSPLLDLATLTTGTWAWQYKSQYNINSKLIARIKNVLKMCLQTTLEISSYCSKRLGKRVPNSRSIQRHIRSLPESTWSKGVCWEGRLECSCVFFNFFCRSQYSLLSLLLSVACLYFLYSATSFVGEIKFI